MRKTIVLLFVFASIFFHQTLAQNAGKQKQEQEQIQRLKDETRYVSPIRYIIVYNDIIGSDSLERRIEIVIDERQFNEENLAKVFDLVKKRFPSPFKLSVEVHTSLATIETPEEREKMHNSWGRLTDNLFSNKTADYFRFEGGREAFIYTTNLSPYERKTVVLVDKP